MRRMMQAQGDRMRRDPVALIWVLGLGLAVVAYLIGPQHMLARISGALDTALWQFGAFIADLSLVGRDVVRALAIGIYATFVALSILVIRRGGRAIAALIWVSAIFFVLIGRVDDLTENNGRWVLALALATFAAGTMTRRLRTAVVPSPW